VASELLTIGKLSRLSGVPVKTIRHYSDLGVLPPSEVAESGYRLYAQADRLRLELIRSLRSLDFDLGTIGRLLAQQRTAREALEFQLRTVEMGMARLRRSRAVLERALRSATAATNDETLLAVVRRLNAVAALDAFARESLLSASLDSHLRGVPIDSGWKAELYRAAFAELPEALTEAQWSALFELVELVQDPSFGKNLAQQASSFWSGRRAPFDLERWRSQHHALVANVIEAIDAGVQPSDERGRVLAEHMASTFARAEGRAASPAYFRQMASRAASHDPRAEQLWELVGVLRGWPGPSPTSRAFRWLFAALAAHHGQKPKSKSRAKRRTIKARANP
jgi:DNA-binding transcriptional MerR regulator